MPKYRKRPIVIEAFQWQPDGEPTSIPEWFIGRDWDIDINGTLTIPTLEGRMTVSPLDWVIKGVAGELYPSKPNIFEATYEKV